MKAKSLTILIVLLIATVVLASYGALTAAAPKTTHTKPEQAQKHYTSFTLEATGTAETTDGEVNVELSIEGKANGKLKTVFHLRTQGGDVMVGDYEAISATKGQGIIVSKHDFIHMNIKMSATYYGGRSTVWILRGETGILTDDNTLPISLESRRVILPLEGYPQLRNLQLDGEITFFN